MSTCRSWKGAVYKSNIQVYIYIQDSLQVSNPENVFWQLQLNGSINWSFVTLIWHNVDFIVVK